MVRLEISEQAEAIPTLADVGPYVLCVDNRGNVCWKTKSDQTIESHGGCPFPLGTLPEDVKIKRVIGPFRIVVDPE